MKRKGKLIDIMACPVCKGDLKLRMEKENGGEVISGSLYCGHCDVSYPIRDGIPIMLPPEVTIGSKDCHGK
jgi:uncharacterized protein YbaR (Trm112 family)